MNLANKTVLITGGAGVIGAALAAVFLERECRVVACDVNGERLEAARAKLPDARVVACDITRDAELARLKTEIAAAFGPLHILVNNAVANRTYSFARDEGALATMDLEIDTNFRAPLTLTRLFLPELLAAPEAAVVNVTSDLAHIPVMHKPLYTSLKAGLHAFTVALRDDLAATRVKVFEVQPPPVGPQKKGPYFGLTPRMPEDQFARQVLAAMEADTFEIRIGASRYTYWMSRLAPNRIRRKMSVKQFTR